MEPQTFARRCFAMPRYVFVCRACKEEFTPVFDIAELESGGQKCPHRGSKEIGQQLTTFSAVTSKKS